MRDIKFRAWQDGQMLYTPLNTNYALSRFFGIVDVAEIMQYTGLKDKNGKEIYEGDVIKSYNIVSYFDASINHIIGVVKFKKSCFMVIHKYEAILNSDCEVIGNIHENPELL